MMTILFGISDPTVVGLQQGMSFFLKELTNLRNFYAASCRWDAQNLSWIWRWNTNRRFSCSSSYKYMHDRGYRCRYQKVLWKLKVPTKVRIFFWLLLWDRLMTREILLIRGCSIANACVLCNGGTLETRDHLFKGCTYSNSFWTRLLAQFNLPRPMEESVELAWFDNQESLDAQARVRWDLVWVAGTWALWKERNRWIFNETAKTVPVINNAVEEIHLWLHEGASNQIG